MSNNQDPNAQPDRVEPSMGSSGYSPEDELTAPEEGSATASENMQQEAATRKARPAPTRKTDEWRRNVGAVFGQGIGRISLIAAGIVVVILIAVGVRTLTGAQKTTDTNDAQFEVPNTPSAPVDINPVPQKEAERRNAVSGEEAERAQKMGGSYQPAFMPNIEASNQAQNETNDIFGSDQAHQVPPASMPAPNASAGDAERRLLEEARRRQEQAYTEAVKKRDEYVSKKQEVVMKQFDKILLDGALNKIGKNTVAAYSLPVAMSEPSGQGQTSGPRTAETSAGQGTQRTPIIRTGNVLYAETASEINTDNGSDAIAVIRGGAWDGSKLIGRVENRPNNIGVKFTTLAPQDGRPAMSINAVALRTEDASQGVAEKIDHHTLERYMALGASSLLSGFGKAYSQTPGTAVIAPSGTTVTTTEEPSSKQVIATMVGELGTNASQEVQRGFNRPSTYITPAGQGIAVFFLDNVYAPN